MPRTSGTSQSNSCRHAEGKPIGSPFLHDGILYHRYHSWMIISYCMYYLDLFCVLCARFCVYIYIYLCVYVCVCVCLYRYVYLLRAHTHVKYWSKTHSSCTSFFIHLDELSDFGRFLGKCGYAIGMPLCHTWFRHDVSFRFGIVWILHQPGLERCCWENPSKGLDRQS